MRLRRQRKKRFALKRKIGFTRPSICEALADDALRQNFRAFKIGHAKTDTVIVTKIKFREIAMQMLLRAMLVRAAHATLEHAEIALDGVRGHVATRVFLRGVFDGFVRRKVFVRTAVEVAFVSVQAALALLDNRRCAVRLGLRQTRTKSARTHQGGRQSQNEPARQNANQRDEQAIDQSWNNEAVARLESAPADRGDV